MTPSKKYAARIRWNARRLFFKTQIAEAVRN
jgi:hypothetical protein